MYEYMKALQQQILYLRHPYVKPKAKIYSLQKQNSQTANKFGGLGLLFLYN